ncbi:Gamma-glutamyl cyclotransferase, AIG2-like [Haladaptatus litoreus]|uniref:Gamma-glutamyl cyclotransferase, AIG2-like n=1 Tax=Haladaptatus litoreus TaxID=553468 RepID=A0A1N7BZX8_9EURY|nr:gamma-glutamylcyclotransferase family protein [Haladaptatus litoreus]SIR56862.1 Gamma-glutamyl cyclotransferase, AIG2-like [Haladaptatus litoreus]
MLVFVYGTLTDPNRVDSVVETFDFVGDAVLSGLHRVDGEYPTLAPGGETKGRLVETPDMAMLDAYEGVGRGLYVRVAVPMEETEVAVYVGDPTRLGVKKPVSWPDGETFEQRVRRYVREEGVQIAAAT